MSDARVCTMCVLCYRADYGHSDYNTEGTLLYCLAGLNQKLDGEEAPWREVTPELAAILDVAKTCERFREGTPAWTNVDHDAIDYKDGKWVGKSGPELKALGYTDDDEAAELLAKRFA